MIACATLVLALTTACGGPPPETRSDAELLQIGNAKLDAVHFPEEWYPKGKVAERVEGRLRWVREYRVEANSADVLQTIDQLLTAGGWTRNDSCMNSNGEVCFTYDDGALNISPSATDVVCPNNKPGCTLVHIWMKQNGSQPI